MQTQYLTYRTLLAPVSSSGISEAEAKEILRQILSSLSELHDRDQTHGSISLDTVAYDYNRMEVILLDGNGTNDAMYLAPDTLETQPTKPADDIYALGVSIIMLLTGKLPEALKTSNNSWNWQSFCTVSDQFEQILNMTLFNEPDCRYFNAGQMLQSIQPVISPSESTLTSLHNNQNNNQTTLLSLKNNPQDLSSKQPLPSAPSSSETRSLDLLSSESNYGHRAKRLKVNFPNPKIHRKAKAYNKTSKVTTTGRIKILTALILVLGSTISGAVGSYFYMQPKSAGTTNRNLEFANAVNQSIDEEIPFGSLIRATSEQFLTQWQGAFQKNNDIISKVNKATKDEKWQVTISTFKSLSTNFYGQAQRKEVTEESTPELSNLGVVVSSPSATSAGLNVAPPRNLAIEAYNPPVEPYNPPLVTYNSSPEESISPAPPAPRVAK